MADEAPIPAANVPPAAESPEPPPAPPGEGSGDSTLLGDAGLEVEKPAGEDSPEGDKSLLDEAPVEKVSKDTTFVLPEGLEVNEEVMGKFKTLAETAGLTKTSAQELLDLYSSDLRAMADKLADSQAESYKALRATWRGEIEADPTFSGNNKEKSLVTIGRAFDEFGSKEAREAFNLTGAGDNPHIVRFIHKMAEALSEGGIHRAGGPVGGKKRGAAALYDNDGAGPVQQGT